MFTLLLESATSLIYGLLLSALIMGTIVMVISMLSRKKMQLLTAVVGGVGFVWIWLQSTLMIAAFSVIGYVNDAETMVSIVATNMGQGRTENIPEALIEVYPVMSIFLDKVTDEVSELQTIGNTTSEIGSTVSTVANNYVDGIQSKVMTIIDIVRAEVMSFVFWRIGFIVIGCILVVPGMMLTMSTPISSRGRYSRGRSDFSAEDRALMHRSRARRGSRRSLY